MLGLVPPGGAGGDMLTGCDGADTFVFRTGDRVHDPVTDFDKDNDEIRIQNQ
ncbi:MAG: hypothetical protein GDA53_09630 [Rhodobacteraceae bacterium]|nr:hypothetical protein [Paracoccaceae bacterium]